MCILLGFDRFIALCNHHHNQDTNIFITPKILIPLFPINSSTPSPRQPQICFWLPLIRFVLCRIRVNGILQYVLCLLPHYRFLRLIPVRQLSYFFFFCYWVVCSIVCQIIQVRLWREMLSIWHLNSNILNIGNSG